MFVSFVCLVCLLCLFVLFSELRSPVNNVRLFCLFVSFVCLICWFCLFVCFVCVVWLPQYKVLPAHVHEEAARRDPSVRIAKFSVSFAQFLPMGTKVTAFQDSDRGTSPVGVRKFVPRTEFLWAPP